MSNQKISQLPEATTLQSEDVIPVVSGGQTKKVTIDVLGEQIGSGAVANKANTDGSNITGENVAAFRTAIGAGSAATLTQTTAVANAAASDAAAALAALPGKASTSSVATAQSTADTALANAATAQSSADAKADRTLSNLTSVSTARDNLELGDSATKDVGTTAGTVAAGDDPRFGTGTVAFATASEIQAGTVADKAIAPDQALLGMPTVYKDIICDARPSPATADDSGGILAAFNGEQTYNSIRIRSRLRTSSILGTPTTGYAYTVDTVPVRVWLNNNSGHNQSTSSNDGRTGACAMRVNATTGTSVQGDTVAYNASAFVQGAKSGATHFLANPAAVLYNGDATAGANGVLLGTAEFVLNDNGFAAAGIGHVISMNRTNASTALDATWMGFRSQAVGTQAIDAFYSAAGAGKIGLDLSTSTNSQAAIAIKANELIALNSTNADSNSLPVNTSVGNTGVRYNSSTSSIEFLVGGNVRGSVNDQGVVGLSGTGSPEGVVVANRGALYVQTDGAVGSTLWAKRGNDGTSTNWETLGSQPNRAITAKAGIILDDLQIFTGRVSGTIRNILNYSAAGVLTFGDAAAGGVIAVFNNFVPDVASGAKFLGSTSNRWDTIYAINALNTSSDAREKTEVEIPEQLLREIKKLKMRGYLRKDGGKIRCGVFAQDVISCFDAAGVDWREWDVVHEDEDGKLSVFYDHLFALKIAALELE